MEMRHDIAGFFPLCNVSYFALFFPTPFLVLGHAYTFPHRVYPQSTTFHAKKKGQQALPFFSSSWHKWRVKTTRGIERKMLTQITQKRRRIFGAFFFHYVCNSGDLWSPSFFSPLGEPRSCSSISISPRQFLSIHWNWFSLSTHFFFSFTGKDFCPPFFGRPRKIWVPPIFSETNGFGRGQLRARKAVKNRRSRAIYFLLLLPSHAVCFTTFGLIFLHRCKHFFFSNKKMPVNLV